MIGSLTKKHRTRLNLSQGDLSDKAGIHRIHISRLENNSIADPKLSMLRRLCRALGKDFATDLLKILLRRN